MPLSRSESPSKYCGMLTSCGFSNVTSLLRAIMASIMQYTSFTNSCECIFESAIGMYVENQESCKLGGESSAFLGPGRLKIAAGLARDFCKLNDDQQGTSCKTAEAFH